MRRLDKNNLRVAVLPALADDLLALERVSVLIAGGQGVAQAVVEANNHGVTLATASPQHVRIAEH